MIIEPLKPVYTMYEAHIKTNDINGLIDTLYNEVESISDIIKVIDIGDKFYIKIALGDIRDLEEVEAILK